MSIKKLNLLKEIYLSSAPDATVKEFARYIKAFEITERLSRNKK